jgi:hypothetical protein
MWLTVAIVAVACLFLLAAWITWSLLRGAATDSSSVAEEYEVYLKQKAEQPSTESRTEKRADKRLT